MTAANRTLWDTHSHILPDFDDGPETTEEALAMIQLSIERGVTGIVATPHSLSVDDRGGIPALKLRVRQISALIDQRELPLELATGMEIRLFPDAADRLNSGTYLPLNGTRIPLIEFDYTQWATFYDNALFNIALAGFTPLPKSASSPRTPTPRTTRASPGPQASPSGWSRWWAKPPRKRSSTKTPHVVGGHTPNAVEPAPKQRRRFWPFN